jgi:TetR/AcrR family transcriptional regulator
MGEEPDRRSQILEAATEEFASQGFRGATIKGIAKRAKLQSQALIYWYFPTKEALFEAVLGRHLPVLQFVQDPAPLLDRPPEEVLPLLADSYLRAGGQPLAQRLVRLIAPELIRRPEFADLVARQLVAKVLRFLKAYFARQVELGRLRPHDVRASARAFTGMVLPQLGAKVLFPALAEDGLTDEEHTAAMMDIFLRGLGTDGPGERASASAQA